MNWFEKLFSKTGVATVLAVLLQAMIFVILSICMNVRLLWGL